MKSSIVDIFEECHVCAECGSASRDHCRSRPHRHDRSPRAVPAPRIDVRIVDKAPRPSTTSKALAIQGRTLELLTDRGVGAELDRLGNRATGAVLYSSGKRVGGVDVTRSPGRHNYITCCCHRPRPTRPRRSVGRPWDQGRIRVDNDGVHQRRRRRVRRRSTATAPKNALEGGYLIAADGLQPGLPRTVGNSLHR